MRIILFVIDFFIYPSNPLVIAFILKTFDQWIDSQTPELKTIPIRSFIKGFTLKSFKGFTFNTFEQ